MNLAVAPVNVLAAQMPLAPLVVSSPHSGRDYPADLLARSHVGLDQLRRLEDVDVDRMVTDAPRHGAHLIGARFARAFVDPNRAAFELDQRLLAKPVPAFVDTGSIKARAGLGTIPSRLGKHMIYGDGLELPEIERRIAIAYQPYHEALRTLLADMHERFGMVILLDCHSMPCPMPYAAGRQREIDINLGDRFGQSCSPAIFSWAEEALQSQGFRVARNRPYAGGYITSHYGRPAEGYHALQIEIRRDLYMNEATLESHAGLETCRLAFDRFLGGIADLGRQTAAALTAA
ncbi:N-formylglutamate amidohydrolase [Marinivivus vitaminiproducens]|uniref:N-formylglutamate amidohydrolase n=1 Tax=Marinivivus vitaminiproducens TaxID=3035935 RepID=UPI0027998CAF|nr:N-formylglutamate amidohydrolase [Geminicoccaceae bacterium SCSIO 64248]